MLLRSRLAFLTCVTAVAACGDEASPVADVDNADPCAPNGHVHREPEGDWCHCNRGYLAAETELACVADPSYVPRVGFDFGDNGEHACWHVANGPYETVQASTSSAPDVGRFHTHYTVTLAEIEAGSYEARLTYPARTTGDYVVYLSQDVPLTVYEGELLVDPVDREPTNACAGLVIQAGYELTERVTYTLVIGPTSSAELALVIEEVY